MRLVLDDVTVTYPDGTTRLTALDQARLAVDAGELVAVVGPSGSGKSTLLAVAATLLTPDHGTVVVDGVDAGALSGKERARLRRERIGIVFQQPNLLPSLTVVEQLEVMATLDGTSPASIRPRAQELLAAVGMAGLDGRRPHELSGGQRQRVNIARALVNDPALLLVDEPTSALDHERGAAVVELLTALTRERQLATVLVTHDTAYLPAADRVVECRDGRLSVHRPPSSMTTFTSSWLPSKAD